MDSVPAVSLSEATSGPGQALDNTTTASSHSMVVTGSAGVTGGTVQLQGSHDGTNWVDLGSPVTVVASASVVGATSLTPMRFVRASVKTAITGGGTVSASVASG